MKKLLSVLMIALSVGLTAVPFDAEAKRLGGSRSLGMKRQATPPPTTPKQTPPTTNANSPATGAAAAASSKSRWLGPLAGLAAGLGLAALASSLGLGEGFGSVLLIMLLVGGAIMLFRMFARQRSGMAMAGQGAGQGMGQGFGGQSAGSPLDAFRQSATPGQAPSGTGSTGAAGGFQGIGSGLTGSAAAASTGTAVNIPADFDTAAFERQAKVNFIRLQAANDAGNLQDLKAFTTPEMYAEFEMDIRDRQGVTQSTEVLDLNAQVFEVVEEGALYIASVRFTGQLREDGATAGIDEIWHLTKPVSGAAGWMLAGIQQPN
ncbi:Tim44-like domain-containing protein [Hydrogenophaga sp. 5NK40-0174]|uniref:Tim44 domain-containing protein n=1 Tax=Hydrogenophaga sp. 5NK40-0174 TaxID=3127649 RepID=UPI0031072793